MNAVALRPDDLLTAMAALRVAEQVCCAEAGDVIEAARAALAKVRA